MAELLGVSQATVSRLASGKRRPSAELMTKIRRHLNWSVDDQVKLTTGSGVHPTHVPTYGREFSRRMRTMTAPVKTSRRKQN